MPVSVRKGKKKGKTVFRVVDASGKKHGEHKTRAKAIAQAQAINLSMQRKKGRKGLPPKPRKS